ncbi:MAG: c-type cytochrome [Anaerolineales bacterium]
MHKLLIISGAVMLILAACTALPGQQFESPPQVTGDPFSSNGEKIYFTSINEEGERISYTEGPDFSGMMSPPLTCASCHGPTGEGGRHVMHMEVMDAPDIRFSALQGEGEGQGEEVEHEEGDANGEEEHDDGEDTEEGGHADDHGDYTMEDFRRAVIEGKHPDGDLLDENMPRWQMSEDDLRDLFEYLKRLP